MSIILAHGRQIASRIVEILQPHCELIHIAGSIRRQQPFVNDIEIITMPKKEKKNEDLFGSEDEIISRDFVEALAGITKLIVKGNVQGRYMQIVLQNCNIILDLFLPVKVDYYRQLAIRTGSSDFSHKVIAHGWRNKGWCGSDHGLRRESDCVPIKDNKGLTISWRCIKLDGELPPAWKSEEEFFQWIGVKWIEPRFRDLRTTLNEAQ